MSATKPWTWSYSKLKNFETCPKRHWHYDIQKDVVEPETPELAEGNALHNAFAKYLSKGTSLPMGMGMHVKMLDRIKAAPGQTAVEQKLAITSDFQPCGYFDPRVWFRTIVDCGKITSGVATIFDWKTGKPKEDPTQLQLMAATVFAHQSEVQRVKSALVFVYHNTIIPAEFTRDGLAEIWGEILPRVRAVQQAGATHNFPPTPSGLCKRYCAVTVCPYHGRGV